MKHRRVFGVAIGLLMYPCMGLSAQTVAVADRPAVADTTILARRVTVRLERIPLLKAVTTIAESATVQLLYRKRLLDTAGIAVTLRATNAPLGQVLERALAGTHLQAVPVRSDLISIEPVPTVAANVPGVAVGTVAGTVMDGATKKPLPRVIVTLDGTKFAGRTEEDGAYRIGSVPVGKYMLVVRRLGYTVFRQSITVAENETVQFNVALAVSATSLQDVVTTVTGPQRRVELGNVVGAIKADSLVKEAPITSVSQLLTARVPGLMVSQGQGTVGGNIRLQIRGLSSVSLTSEPIVIVDGIRYSSKSPGVDQREAVSPLNDLNPNDIETVEVVKGPSAATLYGTDASNGVIVITTKRGKPGPARWSAFGTTMRDEIPRRSGRLTDVYQGWGSVWGYYGPGCTLEFVLEELCTQDSVTKKTSVLDNQYSILQPAQSWTSGASVSGGPQTLRYYLSGTYNDQTGAVGLPDTVIKLAKAQRGVSKLPTAFLRPNGQTLLNVLSNITASTGSKLDVTVNAGFTRGETRSIDPQFQPYVDGLNWGGDAGAAIRNAMTFFARSSTEMNHRFVSSVNGQARLASWLTVRGTAGLDWALRNRHEIVPRDSTRIFLDPKGSVFDARAEQQATSADLGTTATFHLARISFRTSLGTQFVRTVRDAPYSQGSDLPPGASSIAFAKTRFAGQVYEESVTLGNYLEETIGLNDRLFLTGAVRVDGASGFGNGYTSANYPKLSASWLVSQEPWIPSVPGLDELRARIALGVSGRQALPTMRLPGWFISTNAPQEGGAFYLLITDIGNAQLQPERGREVESGFDASLWDRRLQTELTWYRRRTTNLVINQPLAPGFGSTYRNVGLVTGNGFEAQLTTTLLDTRPLFFSVTVGHTQQGTKLVRLGGARQERNAGGGYVEGYPLGARFSRPLLGWSDADGDGIIAADEVQVGDTTVYTGPNAPTRMQRLTANVGLFQQRLRLSALFDRESGGTVVDPFQTFCNDCRARFDRTAPLAEQALYVANHRGYEILFGGRVTRLREVTAAFTVPVSVTRALRVGSSSVALSARNLGLWTRYTGSDPSSSPIFSGVSRLAPTGIPLARTWTLRFDLGL